MSDQPSRVEELGTYEMVWDCKFCGTHGLPARTHKFCPNCGAAQDPRSRRFPADSDKKKVEAYVHKGADVICAACSTPNAADSKFCQQCGNLLEGATAVSPLASQVRRETESFTAQAQRNLDQEQIDSDLKAAGVGTVPTSPFSLRTVAIIGVVAVVVIGVLFLIFGRRESAALVSGHTWERTITIEQFSVVPAEAWCDQLPSGAYSVARRQEQRSSRSVADGEECAVRRVDNGDGTFSERRECQTTYREEPIYDAYCSFSINQWVTQRTTTSDGMGLNSEIAWPLTNVSGGTCLGCEREGDRDENYILILNSENREVRCEVDFDLWERAAIETSWKIQLNAVTGQPICSSLEPSG